MFWSNAWRLAFHVPFAVLAILTVLLLYFTSFLPGGLDLDGGPDTFIVLVGLVWAMGFATRVKQPNSQLAVGIESLAILLALLFMATFTSVSMAIGSGDFVDESLIAIDKALFPFLDLPTLFLTLPKFPLLYAALGHIYDSMIWQPFAFLLVATLFGKARDHEFYLSAWSLGLLFCLLPFHWLPALSPYNYYGIEKADMLGVTVGMPWQFVPILTGLRDGTIDTLSIHQLAGMVTVPSFHACAATVLAGSWWRFRHLRWPMLLLNIGMALAAIPIGSHYAIDIVAGVSVGLVALAISHRVILAKAARSSAVGLNTQPALQPLPA